MSRPENQEQLDKMIHDLAKEKIKNLKNLQKEYQETEPDDGIESMEEYREPLSMDVTKEVNIMLSWGGPSDGFKLRFNKDNELMRAVYWYADWYTYAESKLSDADADLVYEIYMYGEASMFLQNN